MTEPMGTSRAELDDVFIIEDLETLKVLADPLRIRLLESFYRPNTVKRIAEELDIPATKLYYHVKQLEEHGLLRVVDTRIVSGIIEKQYQIVAESIKLRRGLLSPGTPESDERLDLMLSSLFEGTRNEIRESARSGIISPPRDESDDEIKPDSLYLSRSVMMLTPERSVDFRKRLVALVDEFCEHDLTMDKRDSRPYAALVTFYPIARKRGDIAEENYAEDGD